MIPMKLAARLLIAVAAIQAGCASNPQQREDRLASQLELQVEYPVQPLKPVEGVATFRLINQSSRESRGCVTKRRVCSVHVLRDGKVYSRFLMPVLVTDHVGCDKRFSLAPSVSLEWQEAVGLSDFPPGEATFSCSAQVSTAKGCHKLYGCRTAEVSIRRSVVVSSE